MGPVLQVPGDLLVWNTQIPSYPLYTSWALKGQLLSPPQGGLYWTPQQKPASVLPEHPILLITESFPLNKYEQIFYCVFGMVLAASDIKVEGKNINKCVPSLESGQACDYFNQ